VLGVNPAADHGDRRVGTTASAYHDPFVLFGFLAGCTRQIGFAAGVLILAQRQAVLVAKQAASLDVLCGGRFRLGIGVGWNEVEFIGLNENFHNSRPALRGAGARDAGAVGRAACQLCR
jgi:alkanesulfonate monooxygenase SsuD/methylene tetrahydromethanopterin reductase-like flavin-dependent oxidoreductase (luciferase family)